MYKVRCSRGAPANRDCSVPLRVKKRPRGDETSTAHVSLVVSAIGKTKDKQNDTLKSRASEASDSHWAREQRPWSHCRQ